MIEVREEWDLLKSEQEVPKCEKCGLSGVHACTGKPLPKPTPEEEARLRESLRKTFGQEQA